MSFIHPLYLWGLLGMLVPIAIHLWNKKEGKVIKIGSVKLISESTSKKSSSVQFNELLLLLIRTFLIGILILIIAEPQIQKSNKETTPITYLIEPSLLDNEKVVSLLDTIPYQSQVKLLKKGFPEYQKGITTDTHYLASYWQLIDEMQNLHTDSIVVFTKAKLSHIKGARPSSSKNISWVLISTDTVQKNTLRAVQKNDSIEILSMYSNALKTSFVKELIAKSSRRVSALTIPVESIDTIRIGVFYEKTLKDQVRFIEAATTTLSNYLQIPINVQSYENTILRDDIKYDLIVWLRMDTKPITSIKRLVYQPDFLTDKLIVPGDTSLLFFLTTKLTVANTIKKHFVADFLELLEHNKNLQDTIKAIDQRSLSLRELQPSIVPDNLKKQNGMGIITISKWLWLLLFVILIIERIVSKYRKQ